MRVREKDTDRGRQRETERDRDREREGGREGETQTDRHIERKRVEHMFQKELLYQQCNGNNFKSMSSSTTTYVSPCAVEYIIHMSIR